MRHDSDPYIVKKIVMEAEILQISLDDPRLGETVPPYLFDELEPFVTNFIGTLDHFAKLHALNPQLSLSHYSCSTIEHKLSTLQESIARVFSLKRFPNPEDQADWSKVRFLEQNPIYDNEQLIIALYKKLAQILETYYVEHVRDTHFAAMLNDVVGWTEHIDIQGHHDVYAVILFAQKIARDKAVIEHRVDVVREICTLLQERSFLKQPHEFTLRHARWAAIELSRIYSVYLLELYEALLEDMEIIAIAEQDYGAFEQYCQEHEIEVYKEYHEAIKEQLEHYVEGIALYVPDAFRMIRTANVITKADVVCDRYKDIEKSIDILGEHVIDDMRKLQDANHVLKSEYPRLTDKYTAVFQKLTKLKGEMVKPAIQVYSAYMRDPDAFWEDLSAHHAEWIPTIEGAMACLEPESDLYQKCALLKHKIDEHTERME
jgi:hypothetical protein